ncbi:hypothetical protein C8R44DRAFT_738033 [Mycena epipterygia]|nr:hypothetical protein C8R44DRAFT_738033 [Mycena epipterygia]
MTKGKPISEDLRWAIVRMHSLGQAADIPNHQSVSDNGQSSNGHTTQKNGLNATSDHPRRSSMYSSAFEGIADVSQYLHESLDQSCDKYLEELQLGLAETCGRPVSQSTVWRALKRSGYTMMKELVIEARQSQLTRVAIERSVHKRARYKYKMGLHYQPYQLVFVDESSCDRRTSY